MTPGTAVEVTPSFGALTGDLGCDRREQLLRIRFELHRATSLKADHCPVVGSCAGLRAYGGAAIAAAVAGADDGGVLVDGEVTAAEKVAVTVVLEANTVVHVPVLRSRRRSSPRTRRCRGPR